MAQDPAQAGKRRPRQRWQWVLAGLLLGLALSTVLGGLFAQKALDRWVATAKIPALVPATSVTVVDRRGALLRAYTVAGGRWRLPVTADAVDARYLAFLQAYEDKRFYRHNGVDLRAMLRAAMQAVLRGRIVSGGSTLTMQVARLLQGGGTGRWGPKLAQIRLALALERRLGKADILNLYLELAPFGGNIEGVRAASLAYFGKEPRRLTAGEAALLVALPQSPETRRPDRWPDRAAKARNRVLGRLVAAGALPRDEATAAKTEVVTTRRARFPERAAHMADRAVARRPLVSVHRLSIDGDLQGRLETLTGHYVEGLAPGVSAAIVVMDHNTGEILASVGSAGYLDTARRGFIDMTLAIRSPGSTLKPFIYGLAFDRGIAQPETLIEDRPTAFGSYAPQNFDNRFYGEISARDALRYSLNIPAVKLLDAVGPARLMARMRRAGVRARLPSEAPAGLAIALGGLGLSLRDLVTLYAGLANGGQPVRAVTRMDARGKAGNGALIPAKPLMSKVAAWQVANILTGVKGPWLAPDNNLAFKTGTSYGYRDAWAVGFDGRHVIGVWVGRPDGASVNGLVGAKVAAPLLFEAFGRLKARLDPLPPPPPATLILSNAELPPPLRHLHNPRDVFDSAGNGPEIAFPPDGARLDLGLSGDDPMPLVAKIRNGTPPFTWIADGVPIVVSARQRQIEWAPAGPGFLSLSVIDAKGLSQRTDVEIR